MIFLLRSVLFIKGVEIFWENMVGLIVLFCATNIHLKINYSDAVTLPMLSSIKIRNKESNDHYYTASKQVPSAFIFE